MKLSAFESLNPTARSFILLTVAVAYPVWDVGFELGAYGQLFFEKLFLVWTVATGMLIALFALPGQRVRIPKTALAATAFPSLWLVLAMVARASPESDGIRYALFASGLVAYLVCLPYVVYMAVSLMYPELVRRDNVRPSATPGGRRPSGHR